MRRREFIKLVCGSAAAWPLAARTQQSERMRRIGVLMPWTSSSVALAPLLEATRTIPIVFAGIADPVAAGYVESLARPGGNATGFTVYEYSIGGKWLELLKQVAPQVTRVAVLRESGIAAGPGLFGAIQALAPSFGLELRPIDVRDAAEIERGIATFAQGSNSGIIVSGSPAQSAHRDLITSLAARSERAHV